MALPGPQKSQIFRKFRGVKNKGDLKINFKNSLPKNEPKKTKKLKIHFKKVIFSIFLIF
jgi:hypothetical protein